MQISPRTAVAVGALGLGAAGGGFAAARLSTSDGIGQFAVPAATGLIGGAAVVGGLVARARGGGGALLGALPFAGGAVLAGSVSGAALGAALRPATWTTPRGGYGDGGEAWDASDPTGAAHPTAYDPKPGDVLPNVVPQRPGTVTISKQGDKTFLDFSTTTGNLGRGPLELRRQPNGDPIMQIIHNEDGTTRALPTDRDSFEDGPDSNHLAFNDFARYELYHADGAGRPSGEIARSQYKESFLIIDTNLVDPTIDPEGRNRIDRDAGSTEVQGISPGWGDTYGPGLCGQSFDITDLDDGRYVLRQTMDPGNRFAEADETDNTRDTVIEIKDGAATVVSSQIVTR